MALSGTTMSLNRMAASTSYRRSGCSVISTIMSGREQASSIPVPARAVRYSGSDRPACRMYQTGVYGTGLPRQASRKGDSPACGFTSVIVSQAAARPGQGQHPSARS